MADEFITPVFRVRYPKVYAAEYFNNDKPSADEKPKFSVMAIWTPADFSPREKELWSAILKELQDTCKRDLRMDWKAVNEDKRGLRNGEIKADMEALGAGTYFANLSSLYRLSIFDVNSKAVGPEFGNGELIYSGCYCRAKVSLYSYNKKSKGVSLGLQGLQVMPRKGTVIVDVSSSAKDFEAEKLDDAWLDADESALPDDDEMSF